MKRNVSVVRFKFHCNILISGEIIKEMPGSVAVLNKKKKKTVMNFRALGNLRIFKCEFKTLRSKEACGNSVPCGIDCTLATLLNL